MIRISRPEAKREFQKTPAEIIAGVEEEPGGMKLHEVVRPLNDIAARYEVAALTIAEPMPRLAIKIRNMLSQLPPAEAGRPAGPAGQETAKLKSSCRRFPVFGKGRQRKKGTTGHSGILQHPEIGRASCRERV